MTEFDTLLLLMALFYNGVLLFVDLAVWRILRAKQSLRRWAVLMLGAGIAAVALAVVMGPNVFAIMRWWAFGLFGHAALLFFLSAFWLRGASKRLSIFCGAAALVLWAIAFDAFVVEPAWLEVSYRRLESDKLTRPLRIVVVADLQTDHFGDYQRRVLRLAAEQKPDLLLFAGDYVQLWDAEQRMSVMRQINADLRQLRLSAPSGMFAVRGNVDGEDWRETFAGVDVTAVNATEAFELDELRLTCLSMEDSRNAQLNVQNSLQDKFHIVLGHVPDFALGQHNADLLLSGHTHGGQVRLPFIGPLLTLSRVPRAWAAGMTELPGGGHLLVSRGIGMERGHAPRLRFLCRPELAVIDLAPAVPEE